MGSSWGATSEIQLGDHRNPHDEDWDGDQLWDWDGDQVWDETRSGAGAGHLHSVFSWNVPTGSRSPCALRIVEAVADPGLGALGSVVAQTGWLIPLPGAVIAGARPAVLHRDARGDLHNAAGVALAYPDGWGFYAWHGRRVPGWVILSPSIEAITAEENVEVRRCAIESLGWDRFIAEAGLVPVTAGDSTDPAPRCSPRQATAGRTSGSCSATNPRTSPTLSTPTQVSLPAPTRCAGSASKPMRSASSPISRKPQVRCVDPRRPVSCGWPVVR